MPDNMKEIFVRNLNYLMNARGITQADICREMDVSSATVSNWCTGQKFPRVDKLQRIAEILGVKHSTLITEDGLKDYEDQMRLEALHQNPKLGLLFDHSRKMSGEDVDFMIRIAERMLKERDDDV